MAAGDERGLTDQQRRAVSARGVSVALSAGAGCGKTFVLTERFLAQLQPDTRPAAERPRLGQLVAITFTERAAREMRDRIRAACARRLIEAPEEQVDYWLELLRELDSARISTIHSFCGSLLRSHAVEAGLDPQFAVLDQAAADTLLHELLEEQLHRRLAEGDETVIELVVQFGLDRLYEMIRTLLGRRQEIDWPKWRRETAEGLVERWKDYWRSHTLPNVLGRIVGSPAANRTLEIARKDPTPNANMRRRFELLLRQLPNLTKSADPISDVASIQENAKVQGGGSKRDWVSEEVYNQFRDAATMLRELIKKGRPSLAFDLEGARPAAETALRLLGLSADVAEAYDQKKEELGVLDFDDLLIHTRRLLVGPGRADVRGRIASQIRLLLVDEFQDTDPLQAELVEALCDDELTGGKLFFVGDYKQSIYRFRGADPRVYQRLRRKIAPEGRLPLSLNFRSQPAVLGFVNALFCHELGPDYEPLQPHRPQVSPTPAVEFLWATDIVGGDSVGDSVESDSVGDIVGGDSVGDEKPDPSVADRVASHNNVASHSMGRADRLRCREADWIARRIRGMLDSGEKIVWDEEAAPSGKPAARALRPGDIALLFRALSNVEHYEDALRRYGIDYYLVGGHAFYAQQEVYDLLNLLRALESPCDEVSLAGVLRSPFFSLLDETLFWLAQHPEGLFGGLHADSLPAELAAEQRRRAEFAAATLSELRALKDRLPVAQLIGEALRRTGYDAILLAEFLGERKLANLRKLVERARSLDRSGIFTLADFITQLSQFVARQPDEPLAATCPESTDVVRLMTIHQAKGLEFPLVVVPDTDRRTRSSSAPVAFTQDLGPMVKDRKATSGFDLHMLAEMDQQQAELTRLLYVATTRAADYLILSAGTPQLGSARGPWMELIQRRFDLETGKRQAVGGDSVGDDVGGDVNVKVTTAEPPLQSKPTGARARRDLARLVKEARQMAECGSGRIPPYLAPVAPDPAARRRYSFSRLSGALHRQDAAEEPDPLETETQPEPALDPLGLGTLVHAVLAEVAFGKPADVPALVRRHAERHLPDAQDDLDEPIELVRRFLDSPRAARIAAAAEVHAELEFLLAWPPGSRDPEGRYLQGFIDCLYQDTGGEWHLVDYKTNRVTTATIDAVAAEYEMQMLVYALAVERILDRPPAELVLCFLRPGLEHHFPWNQAAGRRVEELVDRAITATS